MVIFVFTYKFSDLAGNEITVTITVNEKYDFNEIINDPNEYISMCFF